MVVIASKAAAVMATRIMAHSRKPDEARRMIEAMFPNLPRVELFARSRCEGWDAWGQEADWAPNRASLSADARRKRSTILFRLLPLLSASLNSRSRS
jgi:N6-adenosine-specific RNA methylase IME4